MRRDPNRVCARGGYAASASSSSQVTGKWGPGPISPPPLWRTLWFLLKVVIRYIVINGGDGLRWLGREFLKNRDRWESRQTGDGAKRIRPPARTSYRPPAGAQSASEPGIAYDATGMVKTDLVRRVTQTTALESPAAQEAVGAPFKAVASALARGDRVVLRRFGMFHTGSRKTGVARNPRTGEPVGIPRVRVVRFRPATGLRGFSGGS